MRTRTVMASVTLAASALLMTTGTTAAFADGTGSVTGNGSTSSHGNSATNGKMSPQLGLVQGSLNKPCVGVAGKVNVGSLVGLIPITVQDVNVLSNPQNQQCTENSTQAKGDESLSHLLDDTSVLSKNGNGNG
ncbi:rodlin [Streptomyces sp. HNM0574]|uniref:rodlin n=1 Tax=Streptomyces sp. HNM0574 TaxID=2714954 RepID=UPI00146AAB22|nr:rodlin [Streptomyces sp. HNM0574]NLU69334.1 RdlA protein [Streptomyces sp. HNM0574]